ncbi:Rhodopirellula transposase [Tautonia plasticadhaerens]|uniref:Rhodopirellula transposase n=2 Tax=Tautonia plasticadhaerens TaxID=2527974 RepID=A0A518H1G4_9BACT|nr:Rhodopirellula transposase [Tautonia plasticadhaerens]
MGEAKFVRRSLAALGTELADHGFAACPTTVARLLRAEGYSPRINVKRFTGPDHPERDRQFRNIEEWIAIFRGLGQPIISVDGKKKELVGNFKNAGAAWLREPEEVNVYDFLSDAECRATPYGIYDVLSGRGHVCVGSSADTPAFAVEAIGSWWARHGSERYRGADELLILADGGGSNGHRPRLWKAALQERIADRYGLHVTVCHYPTGASKWNPVEPRLFGPVSINWAGQPLRRLETMLGWVRGTTVGGFGVTASLDRAEYPRKVKVPEAVMRRLDLERHGVCPEWNDTIGPGRRNSRADGVQRELGSSSWMATSTRVVGRVGASGQSTSARARWPGW